MIRAKLGKWKMPDNLDLRGVNSHLERQDLLRALALRQNQLRYRLFLVLGETLEKNERTLILVLDESLGSNIAWLSNCRYSPPNQKLFSSALYAVQPNEISRVGKSDLHDGRIEILNDSPSGKALLDIYNNGFKEFIYKERGQIYYCLGICDMGWKRKVLRWSLNEYGFDLKEYTNKRLHCIENLLKKAKKDKKDWRIREMLLNEDPKNRFLGYQMLKTYET